MKCKYLYLVLTILLSSCYPFGNGAPLPHTFWNKNGMSVSHYDSELCNKKLASIFTKEEQQRFNYLSQNIYKDPILKQKEYDRYWEFRERSLKSRDECLYSLGYRWNASFYWCSADNEEICKEMNKYRE